MGFGSQGGAWRLQPLQSAPQPALKSRTAEVRPAGAMPASSDREAVSRRPRNSPRLVREAWRQRRVLGDWKVVGAFVLVRTGLRERACWVWQETLRSSPETKKNDGELKGAICKLIISDRKRLYAHSGVRWGGARLRWRAPPDLLSG